MTYVEGFLTPVPTANKEAYRRHAAQAAPLFLEFGATRFVEAWGEDVPKGKLNGMPEGVQLKDDETVVFSWLEYPDKATRDAATQKMMSDPRMEQMAGEMPFDGKRMVWGGFSSVHDEGEVAGSAYVDGVVMPVRGDGRDAYAQHSRTCAPAFLENGAVRVIDAFGDDVQDGKVTDFNRTVLREEGEAVGFGWVEWPSKEARDAGWKQVMDHPAMKDAGEPPFDGKRMVFGGFEPIIDTAAPQA